MTILQPAARTGASAPRLRSVPPRVSSAGQEAVDLAKSAGLILDPWQALVLEEALGERADGQWAAFEVAVIVPRQNGKGSILEARELAGLFLFGEQLILHSAHEFKTAQEAFRRVLGLVQSTPDLERRVARVRTSHGEEGIELKTGARLRFVARSTGSGRGFTGDCVILDEAYNLSSEAMAALLPTMSARPNPQLWYTSSAPMLTSEQLRRVRRRGMAGDPNLAFIEWSAPDDADLDDRAAWAQANPAKELRISEEFIERERSALEDQEFARERLGIAEDPAARSAVIPIEDWDACSDPDSILDGPPVFAVDVTPDRSWASISAAGYRADGLPHVEIIEHKSRTGWVVDRLGALQRKWNPRRMVADPASPAGSLFADCEAAGIPLEPVTAREHAQACGLFYDLVTEKRMRHRPEPLLDAALAGASRRNAGDAWLWSRRSSLVDISPLVAATLALGSLPAPAAAAAGFKSLDDFLE